MQPSPSIRAAPLIAPPHGRRGRGGAALRVGLVAGGATVLVLWGVASRDPSSIRGEAALLVAGGRVAGFVSAYLALVQLLLMARVPSFERAVGFDRLLDWHKALGTSTVLFLAAHIGLVVWGYSIVDGRPVAGDLWTVVTTYPGTLRGTAAAIAFLVVAVTSGRTVRRHLRYEVWWALHLTSYAAVALGFAHQTETGVDLLHHHAWALAWRALFLAVFACVVWSRVGRPLLHAVLHPTRVRAVVAQADGYASLRIGGHPLRGRDAPAGSHVLVRFGSRGLWFAARPYSLSAPIEGDEIRLTIQAVGARSSAVARLRPGVRAIVDGPFGRFTAAGSRAGQPALLIGGAAGITPVRALAEELARAGRDVVVIQRDSGAAPLSDELQALHDAGALRFVLLRGSPQELGHDPLEPLRLAQLVPDLDERDLWVCGPPAMTSAVVEAARSLGVPDAHVRVESFGR